MKPYYKDNHCILYQGHALDILKNMKSESVQCMVTSPPYWGLRNYEIEPQVWDDPSDCEHIWGTESKKSNRWGGIETISKKQASNYGAYQTAGNNSLSQGQFCQKCNAWHGSLGLEPSIELYIQHMVQIFREVKRVLHPSGTLWLNLGDSYNGSGGSGGDYNKGGLKEGQPKYGRKYSPSLKPKDLCGIPWRTALAMQADGWYLRSDIIWHKPNPMPESVTDRPTKSHEYLFLFTKSSKYFYDADAIKEDAKWERWGNQTVIKEQQGTAKWIKNKEKKDLQSLGKKNCRSVWTIPIQPHPEAHFATFPKKLVEPCIKAGSAINDIVLDPFSGSGTVLYMAKKLNRKGVGIELSPEYCDLSIRRLRQQTFDFK